LPFRRISLPTAPSLLHRVSVVSVASFDSLPEDDDADSSPRRHAKVNVSKSTQSHPVSVESPRRRKARDSSQKPVDDRQAAKRRKVVDEFYETEKAYVDGLELIYSVSPFYALYIHNSNVNVNAVAFSNPNHNVSGRF